MAKPLKVLSQPGGGVARRRGFALLITLTMLAFVVLLLVGLASYTRVETAVAGNMQRQAQARENALLALNVALDQLQKHAGLDTRVTATAEAMANVDPQKRRYTGVWSSADPVTTTADDGTITSTGNTPRAWLASGAETSSGVDVTTAIPTARRVTLLGARTDGSTTAQAVTAELQDIAAPGVPGVSGTPVIGRYAYWVGDEGVKAPVAVGGNLTAISYAPFVDGTATDPRARIAQQIGLGAGAATSAGEPAFEVRDANNSPLVQAGRVVTNNQLAFLRNESNAAIGMAALRQNYHAWSPNNLAVIADTRRGGLRQDLSLKPELLGTSFVRWANYTDYMEPYRESAGGTDSGTGSTTTTPVSTVPILPAYGDDPLRRRYFMTPHVRSVNGSHQVAPVLTYFMVSFNVRAQPTSGNNPTQSVAPLEVRARWAVSLWNPYTGALVPENLRIEVSNLPRVVQVVNDSTTTPGVVGAFSLNSDATFGAPLSISLPWDIGDGSQPDRQSWLPGRIYTWRARELAKTESIPASGLDSEFYSRDINDAGAGVVRALPLPSVDGDDPCHLEVSGSESLRITLYAVREGGDVVLARYTSPAFLDSFTTDSKPIGEFGWQFSYVFRLQDSFDVPAAPGTWLTAPGRDPRRPNLGSEFFVVPNDNNPASYLNYDTVGQAERLLDRGGFNAGSLAHDVPLFELPRGPILSLGALQHFRIWGSRPFMIGNPWGVNASLNGIGLGQLFDRFFFSGLTPGVTPGTNATGDLVLPNPLMRPLRKADGAKPTLEEIRALAVDIVPETPTDGTTDGTTTDGTTTDGSAGSGETGETTTPAGNPTPIPGTARSSKFFLQAGAFNLNSVNASAWAAMLRSVRFPVASAPFTFLDASTATGTASDGARENVTSGDAQFFRFSHSAQETYQIDEANDDSLARTRNFRQGMRTLSASQVSALAAKIAELVRLKIGSTDPLLGGPFRSLEEFLSPSALFAGLDTEGNPSAPRSLLEAAIADASINTDANGAALEFSSQFLTQADIMTALAPVLFPRSDTFVIRTHGQAVNPITGAVEGRAWCEATVQRLPDYVEPPQIVNGVQRGDAADVLPADLTSEVNKVHGRRFKIVAFRWLTLSDI